MHDSITEKTKVSSSEKHKYILGVVSIEMATSARIFRYNRKKWSSV